MTLQLALYCPVFPRVAWFNFQVRNICYFTSTVSSVIYQNLVILIQIYSSTTDYILNISDVPKQTLRAAAWDRLQRCFRQVLKANNLYQNEIQGCRFQFKSSPKFVSQKRRDLDLAFSRHFCNKPGVELHNSGEGLVQIFMYNYVVSKFLTQTP